MSYYLFGVYVAFNTVQVISRKVVLWAGETSKLGKVLCCKLPTIAKAPTLGLGYKLPTSEVGDECVTAAPLLPR